MYEFVSIEGLAEKCDYFMKNICKHKAENGRKEKMEWHFPFSSG